MSVIVKGMKMPTFCGECLLWKNGWCLAVTGDGNPHGNPIAGTCPRPKCCPLVELPEKHGRLADIDDAMSILFTASEKAVDKGDAERSFGIGFAKGFISQLPTVIEAEGEE